MRKLLAATAVALSLASPAQAQYFWGSGPGWGQGGGWNACSNCGMRGFGAGGGYYSQWAGATNGFGAGQRGWFGLPSANGYGMGWGGNALVGQTLGNIGMGGFGGGMGPLGILGALLGGGALGGQGYNGAMVQRQGVPPGNYAYGATRYGGGGAYGQPQYRQGTIPGGYSPEIYNLPRSNPGPGYPGGYATPVYRQMDAAAAYNEPQRVRCRNLKFWDELEGYVYKRVCN